MEVVVRDLRAGYGRRVVVEGVSFELKGKEVVVLLGPNGVGKSTLLKCLNRILKPFAGTVYLGREDLQTLEEREVAKRMGYVPQEHQPPFPYTVLEFVLLGRAPHLGPFSSPGRKDVEMALEALRLVGMKHLAERPYTETSGGERRLILIARALAAEPQILLLDEPTAHLDFKNTHLVLGMLRGLVKKKGISAFLSLHDPNLALRYADTVLVLNSGKILACGAPEEVINEETIEAAYGMKVKMGRFDGFSFVFVE